MSKEYYIMEGESFEYYSESGLLGHWTYDKDDALIVPESEIDLVLSVLYPRDVIKVEVE